MLLLTLAVYLPIFCAALFVVYLFGGAFGLAVLAVALVAKVLINSSDVPPPSL